jgi:hypothetical protein
MLLVVQPVRTALRKATSSREASTVSCDKTAAHATAELALNATASLAPAELTRWLLAGGLATASAGRLVPTDRGRELGEALEP